MDGKVDSQTMLTQETLDSESLLGLNFSFDGTCGARLSSGPEGISAQPDLGDFLGFDWSSYPAAFPSDKHEFDVIALAPQMNASQATASRSNVVADISPAQKRKRVDGNDVTDDERSRKKSKRNGMDESDVRMVIMSRESSAAFEGNVPLHLHIECMKSCMFITYDKTSTQVSRMNSAAGAPVLYQRSIQTLASAHIPKSPKT